jgi:hypothetical protein
VRNAAGGIAERGGGAGRLTARDREAGPRGKSRADQHRHRGGIAGVEKDSRRNAVGDARLDHHEGQLVRGFERDCIDHDSRSIQ